MNIAKAAARAIVAGVVATTAAFGVAGQARAVTSNGCTATPLTPSFSHIDPAGQKVLRFTVRLTCAALRSVLVQHEIREQDILTSQLIRSSAFSRSFVTGGTATFSVYSTVPDTELGAEELFHRLRIRVTVAGIPTPWSAWDSSAVVSA